MFPFIGIMADQEPKRAFTPSGSYSMGLFESGDSVDVTADITGTSDFTFMIWAYPTTANQYIFKTSDNTAFFQVKSDGKLRFQILNANLTNSVVESASAISLNTMQMITVTGNTTNGLKLYINDVLNNSSSMPANNNVAGKTWQLGTNFDGSLALFRSWSKELALADVEAHYAYDENLLLQGGVAVSAMTTDQKTSLEFAIEMIQDVPYDSDEFDDRSTNKYAVTNNGVTLFGQSLQVYTDASDLPVVIGINAFNVSTATLNDTNYLTAPSSPITSLKDSDQTWSIRYKPDSTVSVGTEIIWSVGSSALNARASRINKDGSTLSVTIFPTIGVTTDFVTLQSSVSLVQDEWHTITVQIDVNNTLSITVAGVKDSVAMNGININATYPVTIGTSAGSFTVRVRLVHLEYGIEHYLTQKLQRMN